MQMTFAHIAAAPDHFPGVRKMVTPEHRNVPTQNRIFVHRSHLRESDGADDVNDTDSNRRNLRRLVNKETNHER
jgi:hypothetical protein